MSDQASVQTTFAPGTKVPHGFAFSGMRCGIKQSRPDLGLVRGMPEFAETRYKVWRALHDGTTVH